MKEHVYVRWQVFVDDAHLVELDCVVEVLLRAEIQVVHHDHVVVLGQRVREIRPDESGTAGDEDPFPVHVSRSWRPPHNRFEMRFQSGRNGLRSRDWEA